MIKTLRIQNLRSIKDSGIINVKPINILLGANSSGKSTFLRSFPLFAQSVKKKLRGPISWFDFSLVDFGDFKTALNHRAGSLEGITFSYSFDEVYPVISRYNHYRYNRIDNHEFYNGSVEFTLYGAKDDTYIKDIIINLLGIKIALSVKDKNDNVQISINDEVVRFAEAIKFDHNTDIGILPSLEINKSDNNISYTYLSCAYNAFLEKLLHQCDSRVKNELRFEPLLKISTFNKEIFLRHLQSLSVKSFVKRIQKWTIDTKEFKELYSYFILIKIPFIIDAINNELSHFYGQCSYVAPMRAEANRYTRLQGLQVEEVDAFGRNLLEYIASLTSKEKTSLNTYLKDLLGVSVELYYESGQRTLHIKKGEEDYSIADVGFGYSQILPIATKMWHVLHYKTKIKGKHFSLIYNESPIVLIEQPELHLHPIMQAQIADGILKTVLKASAEDYNLKYIIETHSQSIISRVGRRIREGHINPEDVNILLFEKDKDTKDTVIKTASFTEKGQLKNWPYGFFDPEDDDF